MKNKYTVMNKDDNCATALVDINKDEVIEYDNMNIKIIHSITLGHKFALIDIKAENLVKKYSQTIGIATEDIQKGD
ncbi:MAG: SAF domain-containing protein, partial [Candidatus Lokiarchaeota archaeon]|nr:SAF domain-containing protein [Candidatus Lokiarchaeota archaeon]